MLMILFDNDSVSVTILKRVQGFLEEHVVDIHSVGVLLLLEITFVKLPM